MKAGKNGLFLYLMGVIASLFFAASASGKGTGIFLVHPENEAVLPPGKVLFIGRVYGKSSGEAALFLEGGKRERAGLKEGVFSKEVILKEGKNRVRIEFPGVKPLVVNLFIKSDAGYKNHIANMACGDCHKGGFSVMRPEDSLCYKCHDRKYNKKFVHGPLGGGACAICHEPHGSHRKFILRRDTMVLCISCHDQSSSATHVRKAKNRACVKCHNPHASDKEFFLR